MVKLQANTIRTLIEAALFCAVIAFALSTFTYKDMYDNQVIETEVVQAELDDVYKQIDEERTELDRLTEYLQGKYGRDKAESTRVAQYLLESSKEFKLDTRFLAAQLDVESNFNTHAVSYVDGKYVGARGMMQVMPFWIKHIPWLHSVKDLHNPRLNIRAGAYILAKYVKECGGTMEMGLRCYHGGYRAIKNPRVSTVQYVERVYKRYNTI